MSQLKNLTENNFLFISLKNADEYDVCFSYFGWHKCLVTHSNYSSIKQDYTLHIVLSGQGTFCIGKEKYSLQKNDIFLIRPAEVVSYYPSENDPWEYIWIAFNGNDSEKLLDNLGLDTIPVGSLCDLVEIEKIFMQIKEVQHSRPQSCAFTGYMHLLLDALLRSKKHAIQLPKIDNRLLADAENYIKKNYADMTIGALAKYLCVERTTLFKLFKKKFGVSPQKFTILYKLTLAQQYIKETNLSFVEIAIKCGYPNYAHFSRSFTEFYGISPSKMRQTNVYGELPEDLVPLLKKHIQI